MTPTRRVRTLTRFPFCVQPATMRLELPATIRPDGTIDESGMDYAMKWWWRVRAWQFTHSDFIAGSQLFRAGQNVSFYSHDFSIFAGPPQPGYESQLRRPCDGILTYHNDYRWEVGGNSPNPLTGLPPNLSWLWDFVLFNGVGLVDGRASINVGISFFQEDAHELRSEPSGSIDSATDVPEIYIDGVRLPFMYKDPTDGPWSGRVDFTPTLFWTYALPDGSDPIYDELTGAVLEGRNPHERRLR